MRAVGASSDASRSVKVQADTIHTLLVLDGPDKLKITDLQGWGSSRVTPVASVATGLGGAVRGRSLVPWLATMVTGSLLTLTGTCLRRRLRRKTGRGVSRARIFRLGVRTRLVRLGVSNVVVYAAAISVRPRGRSRASRGCCRPPASRSAPARRASGSCAPRWWCPASARRAPRRLRGATGPQPGGSPG